MKYLVLGLFLLSAVHLIPLLVKNLKNRLVEKVGNRNYRRFFSLCSILSLILIIYGWKHSTINHLYVLPEITKLIAMIFIALAFMLFVATYLPTRLKKIIRNPMLTSVFLWSIAHLLLNGDSRSVVLFGSIALWTTLEILLLNKRDGQWVKPNSPAWLGELKMITLSFVVLLILGAIHPYIAGVSLI